MEGNFSFKELYDVSLKATYPIEINGKTIEPGETIAFFETLSLMDFSATPSLNKASGGAGNRVLVYWESVSEIKFTLSNGVFSKTQFALMNNARLLKITDEPIEISKRETLESDGEGKIVLSNAPLDKLFIYISSSGEKVKPISIEDKVVTIDSAFTDVVVDYTYHYMGGCSMATIGQALTEGYLCLEGKMRVKDDTTGQVTTGLLRIPKLKLMSNLSMRLGTSMAPVVGTLNAIGVPVGSRGNQRVCEICFLNNDIDSDI